MNRQQNKIIKLLEKIVEQNQEIILGLYYNKNKGLDWIDPWPKAKDVPPYPSTIPCPYCDKDTGIPQHLYMVIPPQGLSCSHCDRVVVNGSPTITAEQPYSTTATPMTNMNCTLPGNPAFKAYNEITHIPDMLGSLNTVTKVVKQKNL